MTLRDDLQDRRDDAQDLRDDMQDLRDARQQEELDEHSRRLGQLDGIEIHPGEAAANPGAQPASAAQRLRIHVPRIRTTLTMGARAPASSLRDGDRGEPNYPGFGVDTLGHVLLDARGDADNSKMRLQSKGDMTLQTPESFAAGGMKAAILASNAGTVVAGGEGVSIFGGAGLPWSDNEACDAISPTSPPWIANLTNSASNYGTMWSAVDAAIAFITLGMTAKDTMKAVKSGKAGSIAAASAATGGLIGGAISAYGFADGLGLELPSLGGTTVHGSTGLVLGSGGTAGLYSLLGTCIASPLSVGIISANASVIGAANAELKGQTTSIAGWGTLDMIGGTTTVAARDTTGELGLLGARIMIGKASASEGGRQASTNVVSLLSESAVIVETKASGEWSPAVHTPGITMRTHGHLDLRSSEKATIESYDAKEVEVLVDQHNKIHIKDGETTLLANDSMIRLKKDEGVTMCQGTEGGILATKSSVSIGFGSNMMEIKKSGAHSLTGTTIKVRADNIRLG